MKAHDAFQNLVSQQEEKVASLKEHADKLIRQKHFDKDTIQAKLEEVMEKRATVGKLCTHKTNFLNLNYLYARTPGRERGDDLDGGEEEEAGGGEQGGELGSELKLQLNGEDQVTAEAPGPAS